MTTTDLNPTHWLLARLPDWLRPYALLARWDRPVGIWLLLLPCWWGLTLAASGWPEISTMLLCAVGAVVMRGAGCTLNDIIDRNLDAQVERTRHRPLPAGTVTVPQAALFLMLQLAVGGVVLLQFPLPAIIWGAVALVLVAVYPLMKRVTWWPQLFLGLTFNWGVLLGWVTLRSQLEFPALALYCGAVLWTIVYDTIYAHQDAADDAVVGIKSTARLFAANSRRILAGFAAAAAGCFLLAGYAAQLGGGFYLGWALACAHLVWQLRSWRPNDAADCLARFRSNRDFGLLLLAALCMGKLF